MEITVCANNICENVEQEEFINYLKACNPDIIDAIRNTDDEHRDCTIEWLNDSIRDGDEDALFIKETLMSIW